jgi:xanthine dehydrogenase accessory factor
MGMVCGGRVRVLIHFVDASNPAQVRLYGEIHAALKSRKREWLITELPSGEEGEAAPRQALRGNADTLPGTIDGETIRALGQESAPSRPRLVLLDGRRFFVEPLGPGGSVYIFGAGHISRELAPLASLVGFQTIVIDDRVEFANRERFETADEIIVPDSFERAFEGLEITGESFLVLVTRGHSHDKTVLGEALKTGAGYIGMIGSRGKRDAVYDALRKEGFSPREFERVHSPVGLDIGAETPEEIAVSIVAELIRVRAGRNL